MGVHVDEARRHDLARGVDGCGRRPVGLADGDDLAALDADIAHEACLASTVDDRAACDLEVKAHDLLLNARSLWRWVSARAMARSSSRPERSGVEGPVIARGEKRSLGF